MLYVIFVQLFALRASTHCKCDIGTPLCLNAATLLRVHTLCFGRLVRCSAHGRSFMRLQYIHVHAMNVTLNDLIAGEVTECDTNSL